MIQRHISSLISQVCIYHHWSVGNVLGLQWLANTFFPKFYILPIRSLYLITHWPVNTSRSFLWSDRLCLEPFWRKYLPNTQVWFPWCVCQSFLQVAQMLTHGFFMGAVLIQHVKGVLHLVTLKRCILRVGNLITFHDNLFMASYLQIKKLSPFCCLMTGPQPFTAVEVCLALQWSSWARGRGWGTHSWPGARRDTLGFARC